MQYMRENKLFRNSESFSGLSFQIIFSLMVQKIKGAKPIILKGIIDREETMPNITIIFAVFIAFAPEIFMISFLFTESLAK